MRNDRLFQLLLRLYPPGFRRRFGWEMEALHRFRSRTRSGLGAAAATVAEHARAIPAAWLNTITRRLHRHLRDPVPDISYHRGPGIMKILSQLAADLRFAVRSLLRTPAFTIAAVTTLALGIGANTAIFSVVNGVMLKPLPYPEPDRLVTIARTDEQGDIASMSHSMPDIEDMAALEPIEALVGYHRATFTLLQDGTPEVVTAARVTGGLLETMGMPPILGRDIREDENVPSGPNVAVIAYGLWQSLYGGDLDVIGRTITLSDESWEIVGVASQGFDFPDGARVWVPRHHELEHCARGCHLMRVMARIGSDETAESVNPELQTLALHLEEEFRDTNLGKRFRAFELADFTVGDVRTGLLVLLGAVGIVLLIACANVANLLLVRGSSRATELATRAALGAGRGRLIGQLLVEAMVLALVGGIAGTALALLGLETLLSLAPADLPRIEEVSLDGRVLIFAGGLTVAVAILFGLLPAIRITGIPVTANLAVGGRGDGGSRANTWSRWMLLVTEIALSVMLLAGAGLLLRSFSQIREVKLGFDADRVYQFNVALPEARYDAEGSVRFIERLEESLARLPWVESVGSAFGSPMGGANVGGSIELKDRPPAPVGEEDGSLVRLVTPGYFSTLGIPLIQGRAFDETDRIESPYVIVVSEAFVDKYFPDKSPLGVQVDVHVSFGYRHPTPATIIGVVADIRSSDPRTDPRPELYVAQAQSGMDYLTVLVRAAPFATRPAEEIREVVQSLDGSIPIRSFTTLEQRVSDTYGNERFYLLLIAIFATIALLLSAVGLYGVVAYLVSRRTREIGIRIALGARPRRVVRLVLTQALRPAIAGLAAGVVGAWLASRVLESLLYGVEPQDPATLASVSGLLLAVMVLATLVPARRAARIPPAVALRE